MTMRKKRTSTGVFTLLAVTAVLCLGSCLLLFGYLELNRQVEAAFGPPSPRLNPLQRLRFSAQLFLQADQLSEPPDKFGDPVPFEIPLGESPLLIASRLEAAGLIPDAQLWITFLKYTGLDTTLQAGGYTLSPAANPRELAHILQDATPSEVTLSVLPGWRLEQIAASLPTSGLGISPEEFLLVAGAPSPEFNSLIELPPDKSLEGFLYPGSYRLARQTNTTELISILLEGFNTQLTPEMKAGFQQQGLNILEAVILASIVQRETIVIEEMPTIASVFLNRLVVGMPLEADSTVQYARGYNQDQNTWWTNPLSISDLQFNSPYNTYLYPGLPPGPIANPDSRALRAVAFPAQTPYFYFRALCDDSGRHTFSETFEEHLGKDCP
jgi:UPF0755 protein